MRKRRDGLFLFVRGIGVEHPQQARQPKLMGGFAGKNQMSNVGRVEGAAEETYF